MSPEYFQCICSESNICKKYGNKCNGNTDGYHCPDWRLIMAIDQLRKVAESPFIPSGLVKEP